jgi:hypothetical protein
MAAVAEEVAQFLRSWSEGDQAALGELLQPTADEWDGSRS